jgi:hypothetical protein
MHTFRALLGLVSLSMGRGAAGRADGTPTFDVTPALVRLPTGGANDLRVRAGMLASLSGNLADWVTAPM